MDLSTTPERRRHAAAWAGKWAAVSAAGTCRVEEVGKQQLIRMTGLPARDLRALDPAMPYEAPSVAGRDRAIVVSPESVRAVITASEVLVPIQQDPAAVPLIRELRPRLGSTAATASSSPQQLSSTGGGGGQDGHEFGSGKILPFEFRALEVCLELAFKFWEQE
ncbi:unnamed protein product [Miscanthus lutarioriparius]|uniref:Uncharacterized protein n=1 Tax=Miscanthus lutarioriparius TaxID=422564 RepID=A0A811PAI8_9POAL|nr:unnamed protein product [Miscanthus lutarioriparius]